MRLPILLMIFLALFPGLAAMADPAPPTPEQITQNEYVAGRLAVQARLLYDRAQAAKDDQTRIALLTPARDKLEEILQVYPGTRISLTLAAGEPVAGVTMAEVRDALKVARDPLSGRVSFGRRVALAVTAELQAIATQTANLIEDLTAAPGWIAERVDSVDDGDWLMDLIAPVSTVAGVIAATLLVYGLLRWLAYRLRAPIMAQMTGASATGRLAAVAVRGLTWLAAIALAWLAGNGASLIGLGAVGQAGEIVAALFLTAFVLGETIRLGARLILAPREPVYRPIKLDEGVARRLYREVSALAFVAVYGLSFLVPMAALTPSVAVVETLRLLVILVLLIQTWHLILVMRAPVAWGLRDLLPAAAAPDGESDIPEDAPPPRRDLAWRLAGLWHVPALMLVLFGFGVWALRGDATATYLLSAGGLTVVILYFTRWIHRGSHRHLSRGLRVGPQTRQRLPGLERRLNSLVPALRVLLHVALVVIPVVLLVEVWRIYPVFTWLGTEAGTSLLDRILAVLLLVGGAAALWVVLSTVIEERLEGANRTPTPRTRTILALLRNTLAIFLIVFTGMLVLSEVGLDIGPLIAGAGVIGLAIGFGAQTLVKDVITGLFLQLENAMNAGDVVQVGSVSGTVETLSVRSVGIRDLSGTFHLIPFSSVASVANFTRDYAYHVANIGVAYREKVDEVIERIQEAGDRLAEDPDHRDSLLAPIEIHGLTQFGDSAVVIRARLKTRAGSQWAVGRAFNKLLKEVFDRHGIEMPYPHMTLYFGQDKDGSAPPAQLVMAPPGK